MNISRLLTFLNPIRWVQGKNPKRGHVSPRERELIRRLRQEGLTIEDIAQRVRRTPKTVRRALGEAPPSQPVMLEAVDDGDRADREPVDWREKLFQKIEPILVDRADEVLDGNPELIREIVYKAAGVRAPRRTFDSIVESSALDEISGDTALRRRVTEGYLTKWERNGRSELDIIKEAFVLFSALMDRSHDGDWARAVQEMVSSGELRRSIVEFLGAARTGSPSKAASNQDHQRQESTLPKSTSPEGQAQRERAQVVPAGLHLIHPPASPGGGSRNGASDEPTDVAADG